MSGPSRALDGWPPASSLPWWHRFAWWHRRVLWGGPWIHHGRMAFQMLCTCGRSYYVEAR